MLRNPDERARIDCIAQAYMADTTEALGLEAHDQVPFARLNAHDSLGKMAARAAEAIEDSRQLLDKNEKALSTLFRSFIPAVVEAHTAARYIALTEGEPSPLDEASLANSGSGLENIEAYLRPFLLPEDTAMPTDLPTLGIATVLRLKGLGMHGRDGYASNLSSHYGIVESSTAWSQFAKHFDVPVLLDPQTYSLQEFEDLPAEQADGYAHQVTDTWNAIRQSEKDQPSFTGEPLVVRGVSVLPVPSAGELPEGTVEYAVDFLPQISRTEEDRANKIQRAYDARLLVKGNANVGSNYVTFGFGDNPQPIFANHDGKQAPLTVKRAEAIAQGLPHSFEEMGLTPRSQGAIALYLAPHVVKEKVMPSMSDHSILGGGMFGGTTRDATKGLGGASIEVGPASWVSSDRRQEGFTHRIAPEMLGRPIIVSMQLLTFER